MDHSFGEHPQNNCLVRVQETGCTTLVTDRSDAVFSIIAYAAETLSAPTTPTGRALGTVGTSYSYYSGGSVSSHGHDVQYLFDWGDTTDSGWLAVGTTSASHSWSAAGTYNVRAMGRCATHTAIVSAWSTAFVVTQSNEPTWVAVSRFEACTAESQPTVEWHTATEAGAVGFNLWRQDRETKQYELVNPSFLPALPNSPQGGGYRFADPGAFLGEPATYRLEEVDARGRTMSYGPFTVTFGASSWNGPAESEMKTGREAPSDVYGYRRFGREQTLYEQKRLQARRQELQKRSMLDNSQSGERVRITVKGKGLFYVTAAQVANSLGMSEAGAVALIGGYKLSLTGLGMEIAWLADANGAGLFFYNEGIETVYSDKNVYFLERGRGLSMETLNGGSASPAPGGQVYDETLLFSESHYFLPSMKREKLADDWFWDYIVAGSRSGSFTVMVPGVAAAGQATLKVILRGATDSATGNDHHVFVTLNGSVIGSACWDGGNDCALEIPFDASKLVDGANTILVSGALDMGVPYSIFYVDGFELSYPRYYKVVDNTLICRGDGNPVVTVSGLTEPRVVVLDVSMPERTKQLVGVLPDLSGRITFVPGSSDNTYLVSGLNASRCPLAVVGARSAQPRGEAKTAEYIVIAPEEFAETSRELAEYRMDKGFLSVVVTLEDIYDDFNYGVPSPLAIRDFLAEIYGKGSGKKTMYAVLAGKGTYDYKDYQGHGDNLVPAILAESTSGFFAADKVFGDVIGNDGLPEIAIGRLPAVTNAELKAMIDKVKAYEGGQGAWTGKAIFIADDGGDFTGGCNELAGLATGLQTEKIYLTGSAVETRAKIIASWNAGAALVNYCGHAGVNQLATENIFNVTDAGSLQNNSQLPLATMLACVAGRFELPGFTSLGEALVLNPGGGIAGGLMPSGAELHVDSLRLAEEFYKAVFRGQEKNAGAALLTAMKNYLQLGGNASLLNVYNWLGDPALEFK